MAGKDKKSNGNAAKKLLKKAKANSPRQSGRIAAKTPPPSQSTRGKVGQNSSSKGSKGTSKKVVEKKWERFDEDQIDILLTEVFANIETLEGNISESKGGLTKKKKMDKWKEIADSVNRYLQKKSINVCKHVAYRCRSSYFNPE